MEEVRCRDKRRDRMRDGNWEIPGRRAEGAKFQWRIGVQLAELN